MNTDSHKIYQLYVESTRESKRVLHEGNDGKWAEWVLPNGRRHREGKPAYTSEWGDESWWLDGKVHRVGGPAVYNTLGGKHEQWLVHGRLHRDNGPAVTYRGGEQEWWIDGEQFTEEQFTEYIKKKKFKQEMSQEPDKMFDDDFLEGI